MYQYMRRPTDAYSYRVEEIYKLQEPIDIHYQEIDSNGGFTKLHGPHFSMIFKPYGIGDANGWVLARVPMECNIKELRYDMQLGDVLRNCGQEVASMHCLSQPEPVVKLALAGRWHEFLILARAYRQAMLRGGHGQFSVHGRWDVLIPGFPSRVWASHQRASMGNGCSRFVPQEMTADALQELRCDLRNWSPLIRKAARLLDDQAAAVEQEHLRKHVARLESWERSFCGDAVVDPEDSHQLKYSASVILNTFRASRFLKNRQLAQKRFEASVGRCMAGPS